MTTFTEHYFTMTEPEAIEYAKTLSIFPEGSAITCEEIGDGNLNYVFRLVDPHTSQSIIIKQAELYLPEFLTSLKSLLIAIELNTTF